MKLMMLGAHQRTTPISVLERLALSREALPDSLARLRTYVNGGMIVSTCNRVEIYAEADDVDAGLEGLERFLADQYGSWIKVELSALHAYSEEAVVRHIFRLASGLDSMVLGDDQIMGQIKSAYAATREAGASSKTLHRLVDRALAAGKLVRSQTQIASHPVSVVSVALDFAQRRIGSLRDRDCLIVGAGHTADLALKLIAPSHDGKLGVINRTDDRAERLASHHHGQAWKFEALEHALAQHEVIIVATTAPSYLVAGDMIERSGRQHSRIFLDLSVPRGVDPAGVARIGDYLIDIEALQRVSSQNHAARAAEIVRSEALLEPEVQAFLQWRATQSVVPLIRELKAYAEEIRIAELERALGRLPQLGESEQQAIHSLTVAIVNKLLHQPIMALKDPETGSAAAEAVNRMFHFSEAARTTAKS